MDPDFRIAVLKRDSYTCQAHAWGFAKELPCSHGLHVHHLELGTKIDAFDNVVTLCPRHHRHAHDVDRAGAEVAGIIVRRSSRRRT